MDFNNHFIFGEKTMTFTYVVINRNKTKQMCIGAGFLFRRLFTSVSSENIQPLTDDWVQEAIATYRLRPDKDYFHLDICPTETFFSLGASIAISLVYSSQGVINPIYDEICDIISQG
jgi:hypothetical protein